MIFAVQIHNKTKSGGSNKNYPHSILTHDVTIKCSWSYVRPALQGSTFVPLSYMRAYILQSFHRVCMMALHCLACLLGLDVLRWQMKGQP